MELLFSRTDTDLLLHFISYIGIPNIDTPVAVHESENEFQLLLVRKLCCWSVTKPLASIPTHRPFLRCAGGMHALALLGDIYLAPVIGIEYSSSGLNTIYQIRNDYTENEI